MVDTNKTAMAQQREIHEWAEATFPHHTPLSIAAHLLSEAAELFMACGGNEYAAAGVALAATRKKRTNDEIPDQIADVLILSYTLAGFLHLNSAWEVDKKMAVNRTRRWATKPNEHGFAEHIEEGKHNGKA